MKRILLLSGLLVTLLGQVWAQNKTITGKVISAEESLPLPGVNVSVKGATVGTTTDASGHYSLAVSDNATLVFSFIGLVSKEESVGVRSVIDVSLSSDVKQLGEVIVTAIGLKEDRDKFASSVSTVQGTNVVRSGETSALTGLSGKAAGVLITRSGGDPGAGAYIQIRGQNTINGNAQPLFVVDGVPVSNSNDNGAAAGNAIVQQSRINDINPEDIASMEVLKGASAAALWGTRAANGVVIITTKKGKDSGGKVNISFKSTLSLDEVNKIHQLQTTYGQGTGGNYAQGNRTSWGDRIADRTGGEDTYLTDPNAKGYNGYVTFPDGTKRYAIATGTAANPHGGKNSKQTYDHTKDPFQTGHYVDNNITISGGNAKTNFLVSYSNLSQQGIVKSFSDYYRNNARINVSSQFTNWFRLSANVGYTKSFSTRIQEGDNLDGILLGGLRTSPDFDNTQYTGTYTDKSGLIFPDRHVSFRNPLGASTGPRYSNPLWNIHNNKNTTDVDRVIGNLELSLDPTSWLNIIGRVGVDNFKDTRLERFPQYSASFPTGFLSKYWIAENQFNVDVFARASKTFSENFGANLLVGVNFNNRRKANLYSQITSFVIPDAPDILTNALNSNLSATTTQLPTNPNSLIRTYAYYAQADFQAYDMFFLTFTGRNESASTYASSFFFPSAALAWQFTKLGGLQENKFLSFGKLRLTWGQVGIQPQPYLQQTTFNSSIYSDSYASTLQSASALYGGGYARSSTVGNPALKPERKTETEIGTDLRFFNNRLSLSATVYSNETKDVILSLNVPAETGYTIKNLNAAKLSNKGLEIEVGYDVFGASAFRWNISGNFSINRNKVVSLAGSAAQTLPNSYGGSSLIEGQPFGTFYGTDFLKGENGKYLLDANGYPQAGTQSEIMGNPNPKWRGGLGNTFSYKGLSLYVLFDAVQGNDFYNGTRGALYTFGTHADNGNTVVAPKDMTDVNGDVIKAGTSFQGNLHDFGGGLVPLNQAWYQGLGTSFSSASAKQFIEKANVTRLREITLSYSLRSPGFRSKTKLSSIDFSLTGRNLALWTPFTGVDPEVNITGAGIVRGEDWFTNPNTRSFLFSIKISY